MTDPDQYVHYDANLPSPDALTAMVRKQREAAELTPKINAEVARLLDAGWGQEALGELFGVSRAEVSRRARKHQTDCEAAAS